MIVMTKTTIAERRVGCTHKNPALPLYVIIPMVVGDMVSTRLERREKKATALKKKHEELKKERKEEDQIFPRLGDKRKGINANKKNYIFFIIFVDKYPLGVLYYLKTYQASRN